MIIAVVLTFVIGYLAIVLEHPLKLDKTVPALLMGAIAWGLVAVGHLEVVGHGEAAAHGIDHTNSVLLHHLGKVAEILVFLIGAMTIVELVDLHKGFGVITDRIKTTKKSSLLWIISILAFFLSSVLDNLTTTIVMISLLRRLVPDRAERMWFVCYIVVAANAGGAWSPIGDVTTTMLWIGKKVSSGALITSLFIPSAICLLLPLLASRFIKAFRGNIAVEDTHSTGNEKEKLLLSSTAMLIAGLGGLIFVPIFKSVTHLPPYIGMMLSMAIVWLISEYIHPEENFQEENRLMYSARKALSRIELTSILFFLGILLAIAALESVAVPSAEGMVGLLESLAIKLHVAIPNNDIICILLGVLSAIIDNVPLVAAVMGMYDLPMDDKLWEFIAYTAGTGGSMLIIGSAAGVAAMGIERIDFLWFLRKFTWIAALGFFGGAAAYLIQYSLFHG